MSGTQRIFVWIAASLLAATLACSGSDTAGPGDLIAPQAVTDGALAYAATGGSAVLTWTAPADDETHDTVERYEIRYSHSAPFTWDMSVRAPDTPVPAQRGTPQSYEFANPYRGRDLYAAIRSFDAAGNASPISEPAHVYIDGYSISGVCTEVKTGRPLPDLDINITAGYLYKPDLDGQGRYVLTDLTEGIVNVSLRSGLSGTAFHDYDRSFSLEDETSLDHIMIEHTAAEFPSGGNILTLCMIGAGITRSDPQLKKWRVYPISVFVPSFVNNLGVDYENSCKLAAVHWNVRTGIDIFELTDVHAEADVTMEFKTPEEMGIHNGLAYIERDAGGFPDGGRIDIVNSFGDADRLWLIALHEFGHIIHLEHLPAGYLMYGGQPLPPDVTADEVKLVQLLMALPNGLDMSVYDRRDPR